jgi:nitroreductase
LFLEKKYLDFADKIAKTDTVVTISVNFSGLLPEWEEIAATSMAVQNMYLTCTANQIGCYWSSHTVINHLGGFLNLEENQRCLGLFYLGKV